MAQTIGSNIPASAASRSRRGPRLLRIQDGVAGTRSVAFWLGVLAFLLSGYACLWDVGIVCDEFYHFDQIQKFLHGDFHLTDGLSMIPGYHALIALGALILGHSSLAWLRGISLGISFLSIVAFDRNAAVLDATTSRLLALQYLFLPIVCPYFFLLYTDIASLSSVLLMLLAAQRKQPVMAGLCGAVSVLLRQNNIVWVAFTFLLLLLAEPERSASLRCRAATLLRTFASRRGLFSILRSYGPFFVTFLGFTIFIVLHRGVAMVDRKGHHPFPAIHFGNIYFLLFLGCFLFLPLHIANAPQLVRLLRTRPVAVGLLVLAFYLFYLATFVNDHEYNQLPAFLRNRILLFGTQGLWQKTVFFLPLALTVLSLSVVSLRDQRFYLLYPFTVLYLLPSWLIEDRYCIIPVTLFLLFVQRQAKIVEYATCMLYPIYLLGIIPLQLLQS